MIIIYKSYLMRGRVVEKTVHFLPSAARARQHSIFE